MTAETELDEASMDGVGREGAELLAIPGAKAVISAICSIEGPPERETVRRASGMMSEAFSAAVAAMEYWHLMRACFVVHPGGSKTHYLFLTLRGHEAAQVRVPRDRAGALA